MGAGRLFAVKNPIFQSKTGETACGELARPSACQDLFDKPRATALSSAQSSPAVVGARGFCVPNSKKSSANRRERRLLARSSACQSPFYRLTPNPQQCTDVSHCLPAMNCGQTPFLSLKRWRGIAARYAKNSSSFLLSISDASLFGWLF